MATRENVHPSLFTESVANSACGLVSVLSSEPIQIRAHRDAPCVPPIAFPFFCLGAVRRPISLVEDFLPNVAERCSHRTAPCTASIQRASPAILHHECPIQTQGHPDLLCALEIVSRSSGSCAGWPPNRLVRDFLAML